MTAPAPVRSVEQWVRELASEWVSWVDQTVKGFTELGAHLIEAKNSVKHGEWLKILDKTPFDRQTAQRMMRIARRLSSETIVEVEKQHRVNFLELLPPDQHTVDQITRLWTKPRVLSDLLERNVITPRLKRNELQRVLNADKVDADRARVQTLRIRPGKFKTIILDPAWEYEAYSESVNAKAGYVRQSMEELRALDVKQWAEENCHLWCWTTDGYIEKALELVRHWGFQYRQMLVWTKPHMGRGQYMRTATEHALFCTLGDLPPKTRDIPTYFNAKPSKHSEKPDEFYEIVRAMCWEPYGEANQRRYRPGFSDTFMVGESLEKAS